MENNDLSTEDFVQQLIGQTGQEQAAHPAVAVEEGLEQDEQPEVQAEEEAPAEEAAPEEDDGFVELELDGETYRVPPKLKEASLRWQDYTQKTQEVSALVKTVQANQRQQALVAQFQAQTSEDQQQLAQAKAELARFKNLDWTGLDTDTILKTRIHIDGLKDRIQEIEGGLNQKAQRIQQEFSQLRREAAKNAYEYIGKHVKDWTPDSATERDVAQYASRFGLEGEVLGELAVLYPGIAVLAHKASQFDKLQASRGQTAQKVKNAPPVVKPGAVAKTNTAAAQRARDLEGRFAKSGSKEDFARLLLAKGMVK